MSRRSGNILASRTWSLQTLAPLHWKGSHRVLVDLDVFHKQTNEQLAAMFGVMAACPQHTFLVQTARAKRMREWFEWSESADFMAITCAALDDAGFERGCGSAFDNDVWPLPNVWLGVSVENQDAADKRIPDLLATPAAVRWISAEPLLGPVILREDGLDWLTSDHMRGVDWVVVGCEDGSGARVCDIDWLRSLRDQCSAASVPFFLRQARETDLGRCGDENNPNGDRPCGKRIRAHVVSPDTAYWSCGCTIEGSEDGDAPELGAGDGSKRRRGGIIELPYLDGVQHVAMPLMPQ